ncbi:AAA family ATPase [Geminicoccus roseus]|uniref:AAA family ATPase n=1 Tax=Geminicoccus roseus TaxID=404900 RepID=UPI0004147151|nr:MoxR family ATPase [Geminicoccus roseus]
MSQPDPGRLARPGQPEALAGDLERLGYFAGPGLATALALALHFNKPLLLEGEPGVGKTEVAQVLATWLERPLIRLQCHDGIDAGQALYEWNHARQLLAIRSQEGARLDDLFDPSFLIERPLLKALRMDQGAVLLIDEIDRADAEFEAYLLEFLADFRITVPELGAIAAKVPPVVVLTSNRTRELHDALKRRCLYHWIDFPEPARERRILEARVPGLRAQAAAALVEAITTVRRLPLAKRPGIAETVDWARAVTVLEGEGVAWPDCLRRSLGLLLKDQDDLRQVLACDLACQPGPGE